MLGAEEGGQLGQVQNPGPPLRILEALAPYFWLFHCKSVCQITFGCDQCQVLFCSTVVQEELKGNGKENGEKGTTVHLVRLLPGFLILSAHCGYVAAVI